MNTKEKFEFLYIMLLVEYLANKGFKISKHTGYPSLKNDVYGYSIMSDTYRNSYLSYYKTNVRNIIRNKI